MLSVNIHLQAFRAGIVQIVVFWVLTQFQRNTLLPSSWMTRVTFWQTLQQFFQPLKTEAAHFSKTLFSTHEQHTSYQNAEHSDGYVYCEMLDAFRAMVAVHVLCHALHLLLIKSPVFDAGLRARLPCCQLSSE